MNNLIVYLMAVQYFAKDIHYSCHSSAFYGKHLFADRIQENLNDYIDQIKEICLLGEDMKPLPSIDYLKMTVPIIPIVNEQDDKANFEALKDLLVETLAIIDSFDNLTTGEENLIGTIAQDLQNNLGLINLQLKD